MKENDARGVGKGAKISGAPNGARKCLNPLILGLFRREAAKIFGGVFENFGIFPQNLEFFPPLFFPFLEQGGEKTQRYGLILQRIPSHLSPDLS